MCYLELTHRFVILQISLQLFDHIIFTVWSWCLSEHVDQRANNSDLYTVAFA